MRVPRPKVRRNPVSLWLPLLTLDRQGWAKTRAKKKNSINACSVRCTQQLPIPSLQKHSSYHAKSHQHKRAEGPQERTWLSRVRYAENRPRNSSSSDDSSSISVECSRSWCWSSRPAGWFSVAFGWSSRRCCIVTQGGEGFFAFSSSSSSSFYRYLHITLTLTYRLRTSHLGELSARVTTIAR